MDMKKIIDRYIEAQNCGFNGSLLDYIKAVGFKIEKDHNEKETK